MMTVSFFVQYSGNLEDDLAKAKEAGREFALYIFELGLELKEQPGSMKFYNKSLEIEFMFLEDTVRKITITGDKEELHKILLKELYEFHGIIVYEGND